MNIVKKFQIDNDNIILFKKLHDIDIKGCNYGQNKLKNTYDFKKSIMAGNKKKEIIKMAQENLHMLKRLTEKTSCYDFYKYEKEYNKAQYYKRSLCVFPSIDFYKTRSSSFGKNNYCMTPCSQQNNYFPMTTTNMYNTNPKKKRFEDFHYEDFINVKTKKEDKKDKNNKTIEKEEDKKVDKKEEKKEEKRDEIKENKSIKDEKEDEIKEEKSIKVKEDEKIEEEKDKDNEKDKNVDKDTKEDENKINSNEEHKSMEDNKVNKEEKPDEQNNKDKEHDNQNEKDNKDQEPVNQNDKDDKDKDKEENKDNIEQKEEKEENKEEVKEKLDNEK